MVEYFKISNSPKRPLEISIVRKEDCNEVGFHTEEGFLGKVKLMR